MTQDLLNRPIEVVNVGLPGFAQDLHSQHVPVVQVDWTPPARGNADLAALLARLSVDEHRIAAANGEALQRLLDGEPMLVDVVTAGDVVPDLGERVVQHAGPPITWERMCGPLRGAIAGAIVYEGWAGDLESATALAASGAITFRPNHDAGCVGPMTGMITRTMPVFVVENRTFGNRAYSSINEGLGKVMRFGGNDASVIERLHWLRDVCGPRLGRALRELGGIALGPLIARGLAMGDEMHQRNVACTALFLRATAAAIARGGGAANEIADVLQFIGGNDQFFLNIAMAMGKAMTDPMRGIPHSTLVTAMCRNGTDFGIRVSATGATWFTAPVEMPQGLYFPGYSEADANPDIGDSAILETIGLGAFAMAASPAVVGFVGGGGVNDAIAYTRDMAGICVGDNPKWPIPMLDFAGAPSGIDVRRVVATGIAPAINTGIAHKQAGIGQVGAGIARAPLGCFDEALRALAER